MTPELLKLKRNDVKSALRVRQAAIAAGTWTSQDEVVMYRLQDDPDKLMAAIVSSGVMKALPRMSPDQREEANKKVGAKPLKAGSKQVGTTGKVRYGYPGEKGGDKQQKQGAEGAPKQELDPAAKKRQEIADLPHPDLQPPGPSQEPIAAEHPEKPPAHDVRGQDPNKPINPKHTINVAELCAALNVNREVLQKIAMRIGDRNRFMSFMQQHLKQFVQEHGLDGDYFGLLFDVLTGKVPEGQPASAQEAELAKKPKPVA